MLLLEPKLRCAFDAHFDLGLLALPLAGQGGGETEGIGPAENALAGPDLFKEDAFDRQVPGTAGLAKGLRLQEDVSRLGQGASVTQLGSGVRRAGLPPGFCDDRGQDVVAVVSGFVGEKI